MKLPSFISKLIKKEEKEIEYFLSLLFTQEKIKAAVWKKDDQGEILSKAEKNTSSDWQEIITDADTVISLASGEIPQEKIKKVIFGLPPSWTKDNKIQEPYLSSLRKLATELSLAPIGFIVNDEAITHFISKSEGAPATLILLGFKKDKFSLTLVKVGKIEGIKEGERKEGVALCEEINRILKDEFLNVEVLPSKIVLYNDSEDLEMVKQELISYPWLTKAKFLHFPQIEILEKDFDLKALVASTAMEMGTKIAQEAVKSTRGESILDYEEDPLVSSTVPLTKEEVVEKTEAVKIEEAATMEAEDFGFVKDKDIIEETPEMPDLTGFQEKKEKKEDRVDYTVASPNEERLKKPSFRFKLPVVPKFNFNFDIFSRFKNTGLIITFSFIGVLVLLGFLYWRLPHAKIVLLVSPKTLEKEEDIIIDPNITISSLDKKKIPGTEISLEEKGSKKGKTTGKKIVGEKAKGEVTIFNKTNYAKKFNAGTVLISTNNLNFTLNEEVTIASQSTKTSSDETITLTPGKAKVKVTAFEIGPESNLSSGSEFKIEDYSIEDYKAKNEDSTFSGGSSREISIVSQDDQEKLSKLLTTELLDKAKKELAKKTTNNQKIIEEVLDYTINEKKFDKDVNEETNELNLEIILKTKTLAYHTSDLENIITSIVGKSIPEGYEYKKEEVEKEVKEVTIKKDKSATLKTTFVINLLPKIDTEKVKKNLSGKSLKVASEYLNKIPNVTGFEAKITPRLPGFLYTFPRIASNIKVEVKRN